jgi:apolipoprotein N-acyltransferase
MPFRWFPGVDALAQNVMAFDFNAGTSTDPIKLAKPEIDIIPCICFEDSVGRLTRKFIRPTPQMIVNITNDGWFKKTAGAEQHLANARFRCIELRRPMVRSANTGVTCIIDESGRIQEHQKLSDPDNGIFIEGFVSSNVRVPKEGLITFYAKFGDIFSITVGLIAFLTFIRRRIGLRPVQ